MNESKPCPTPRTDDHWNNISGPMSDLNFARSLERELIATQLELKKWKDGCLVNADNAKDALRRSDELRLELRATQLALKECAEAIGNLIKVDGSRLHPVDMTLRWLRVEQALSNPLTQQAMKGK